MVSKNLDFIGEKNGMTHDTIKLTFKIPIFKSLKIKEV